MKVGPAICKVVDQAEITNWNSELFQAIVERFDGFPSSAPKTVLSILVFDEQGNSRFDIDYHILRTNG